jgi:hypothetical protein
MLQFSDVPIFAFIFWLVISLETADDDLIKKNSKLIWIFAVLILIIIGFYNYQLHAAREQTENLKKLYQTKNDIGFLTLLREGHSYIPLAETLEKISKVTDEEDPAKVQKLIELAKSQADEADYYLGTLIQFSDSYVNDINPQFMVNHTVMTSKKQEDMYILASQAGVFMTMYQISYNYWKDKPKQIPQETKEMLHSMAKELRALDDTLQEFKEKAIYAIEWGEFSTKEQIKDFTQRAIKPHLEKLIKMKSEFGG